MSYAYNDNGEAHRHSSGRLVALMGWLVFSVFGAFLAGFTFRTLISVSRRRHVADQYLEQTEPFFRLTGQEPPSDKALSLSFTLTYLVGFVFGVVFFVGGIVAALVSALQG